MSGRDKALVALVCVLCYCNFGGGAFHYDDFHSLVENPHIRSLGNVPAFFTDPAMFSGDAEKKMYRPLLLVTYAVQYAVHGYQPLGFLLVNLAIHLSASLLIGAIGARLVADPRAGLVSALFFAAHPLAGEPVNYISSRSESLGACFYLAAFLLHLRDRRSGAVACYALGLLVKSVVLTAPLVLWAHDRWLGGGQKPWRYYAPFAAVGAGYIGLITYNRFLGGSLAAPVRDWTTQLLTQSKTPAFYAQLVALPWPLNVEHQFFESARLGEGAVLAGSGLVLSLALLGWIGRDHIPGFALFWIAVVLLPTTLMPLNILVVERRMYLPLAALALAAGYLCRRLDRRWHWAWLACALGLCLQRNPVWASELRLWEDAVARAPHMQRVQSNWGKALQLAGRWDEAMIAYRRAIAIDGRGGDAYNNIATILHLRGDITGAIPWYHRALEREPTLDEVHQNLADAHAQLGRYEAAIAAYRRALEIDAGKGDIWSNYGLTLYQAGDLAEAEAVFRKAIELMPDQAEPYNNLGNIYVDRGDWPGAEALYRQALARQPDDKAQILANLGDLYRKQQRYDEGRRALARAIDLEGDQAEWRFRLGRLERAAGRGEAATAGFAGAIALDSTHVAARTHRAEMAAAMGAYARAIADFGVAVAVDPASSRAWFGLGRVLDDTGEWHRAAQAYRQFLSHWPQDDARARHARERLRANEERH